MSSKSKFFLSLAATLLLLLTYAIAGAGNAAAVQLQLTWIDNATNEDGFKIERANGLSGGTYSQVAQVAANVVSYLDNSVTAGSSYCYRVRAYNVDGNSPYSNPACGTVASSSGTTFTLSVNLVKTINNAGTGNGTVTSSPAGISCGADCSEAYNSGASVTLTAAAASGSLFSGWSGACSGTGSCTVAMTANTSVTATFAPRKYNLFVDKRGKGKVQSAPLGIDCGVACSVSFSGGATVTLTPMAETGATFLGWSGACSGTGSCTVALNADTSVAANFSGSVPASIGVFRPATGEWFLDQNGNGALDDCSVDTCVANFGQAGDLPVTGPWTGAQSTSLGVFDAGTATWYLDSNGNATLDGCELDTCKHVFGQAGDVPVVGDWTGNGQSRMGVYRPATRQWFFDINNNGALDRCKKVDACSKSFGNAGDVPVVGDWTGTGKTKIGVFRPTTGQWLLDLNGDQKADKRCHKDLCVISFGQAGDIPVVGDWDGSGTDNIGLFRPSTGQWMLDSNGNGLWDGCNVDTCLTFGQAGDRPVVGKW